MSDDDYLKTADVWTVLDLIAAEFASDPMSVQCFDLRLVARAKQLAEERRTATAEQLATAAFTTFARAFADFLPDVGWSGEVAGRWSIRGPLKGVYVFLLEFKGQPLHPSPAPTIILPGSGDVH